MYIKLSSVVTSPYIYHGCSTRKTLWEENFTLGEFKSANMRNCVRQNIGKHREINDSDKYITLVILLEFVSIDTR